jgi:hypothetical protein
MLAVGTEESTLFVFKIPQPLEVHHEAEFEEEEQAAIDESMEVDENGIHGNEGGPKNGGEAAEYEPTFSSSNFYGTNGGDSQEEPEASSSQQDPNYLDDDAEYNEQRELEMQLGID